ncbi:succinyl-CoA synthetase subunit beta [Achromatium sp. WMS3]|nr:succinyl-CoA synthetase subunit beta [Achromatium sp. WMS3]
MHLHEFQSKKLLSQFGVPIPRGTPATSAENARQAAEALGGKSWMVKAQAHTGGRGKAGGVLLAKSLDQVAQETQRLIGSRLITHQSGPQGLPVNTILIEEPTNIDRELYLSLLVDRSARRNLIMASSAGGMDIEEVAAKTPEKILTTHVGLAAGLQPWQCRKLAFGLGLAGSQIKELQKILDGLYRLFCTCDASLLEINPLVVRQDGTLIALDAKINLDENALYRHSELVALRDPSQEDAREMAAKEQDLNYISLDGTIGCMVNGAGLAMATMDLVQLHGGTPANFLDVGGTATAERVAIAFKLVLSDPKVKAVLVNIFGGIVRCDLIAEGIIQAVKEVGIKVPVVVRLEGTNATQGLKLLEASNLKLTTASTLQDAADKVVAATENPA